MIKRRLLFTVAILCLLSIFLTGCCCCISNESSPPPAGNYGVSSVGAADGSVYFSESLTNEIMVIEKDGTGTFYFNGQEYDFVFEDGKLQVDGRSLAYQYMDDDSDEWMLLIYWPYDSINTIILRPISDFIFFQF